ncbi:MAG: recombinase family protein, partial [Bryobacteraceae bacterium]
SSASGVHRMLTLHELREYVVRRGWEVFAEYVDTGFSGAQATRPELDRLLRDARLRRFEAVLVWKLDRWGRSVAHCVRSIQELVSLDIRFLSPTESIDTGAESPMSRFLLHLFAAFAEMEREIIRERVRAGVRAAKAQGTAQGRPRRVFRRDEAQRLRAEGLSWRKIAQILELPMSTVIDACHLYSQPLACRANRSALRRLPAGHTHARDRSESDRLVPPAGSLFWRLHPGRLESDSPPDL